MPPSEPSVAARSILAAATVTSLLLIDAVRVFAPSLVVVIGERPGSGLGSLVIVGLGTLALAPLLATSLVRVPPRVLWLVGAVLLLGARLGLSIADGGAAQVWTASTGVIGGTLALTGLAAGSPRGDLARIGILAGAAGSFAWLASAGGIDLAWRDGVAALMMTVLLVAISGLFIARATRLLDGGQAAAWPWATLGPALLLLGILVAPVGRIAEATAWSQNRTLVVAVLLMLTTVLGALGAARFGPLVAGPAGAALVLAGTATALQPTTPSAVMGQAALALGLGAVVASGPRGGSTTSVRRGTITALSLLVFGVLLLSYYGGYLVRLPFDNRLVLLLSAVAVGGSGVVSAMRAARLGREPSTPILGQVLVMTTLLSVLLVVTGLRPVATAAEVTVADEVRIVLANVHFGFDPQGRLRAREVGDLLATTEADVIVLNEVDRGWLVTGARDLLSIYTRATGLDATFAPASDEVFGNAILTRLPILEVSRDRLPRGRDPLVRSALTVVVELPDGRPLAIIATQLSDVDRQGDTRLPQAQSLASIIARLRDRGFEVIVAGTLHAQPGDPEFEVLDPLLLRTLPEPVRTFPANIPRSQLDHILVPLDWEVSEARAFPTGFSDHRFVEVLARRSLSVADGG